MKIPTRNNVKHFMMKKVNTMQQSKLSAVKKTEIKRYLGIDKNSGTIMYMLKKPNLKGINFLPMVVQDLHFLRFNFKMF
jgi:hypothetical protein